MTPDAAFETAYRDIAARIDRLTSSLLGTLLLVTAVVGSGIMAA